MALELDENDDLAKTKRTGIIGSCQLPLPDGRGLQLEVAWGLVDLVISPTQSDLPTGKVGYKPLLFKKECLCHTHRILRSTGLREQPHILSKNDVSIAEKNRLSKGGWLSSPSLRRGSPSQKNDEENFAALNLSSFDLCEPTRVYDGARI